MLVTADHLVYALLLCNVAGLTTSHFGDKLQCSCLPSACAVFNLIFELFLSCAYIVVSASFFGYLSKLVRQRQRHADASVSFEATSRQYVEIAKVRPA